MGCSDNCGTNVAELKHPPNNQPKETDYGENDQQAKELTKLKEWRLDTQHRIELTESEVILPEWQDEPRQHKGGPIIGPP